MRTFLFGPGPDRAMLNYRLRQYMTLLHAAELEEHVLALDPRVTYLPFQKADLLELPSIAVQAVGDNTSQLYCIGEPQDDARGCLQQVWNIEITNVAEVTVTRLTPTIASAVSSYTESLGASNWFSLPSSALRAYFTTAAAEIGSSWVVTATARPRKSLVDIFSALTNSLDPVDETRLFGAAPAEPYKTFANLWRDHHWWPHRFGGLLLAIIYRLDQEWQA